MIRTLVVALAIALTACGGKGASHAEPKPPTVEAAPLTRDTLEAYLRNRFALQVAAGSLRLDFVSDALAETVLEELSLMGITTTAQFAAIVPKDFDTRGFEAIAQSSDPDSNIIGLVRDLMIMHDVHRYHAMAWRDTWSANGPQDFPAPAAYGVPEEKLLLFGGGEEEDGEEGGVEGGVVDDMP